MSGLAKLVFGGFAIVAGYYLFTEHTVHVLSAMPLLLFLSCPMLLLQWPKLLTLAMYPLLLVMYVRLARHEEKATIAEFGDAYRAYMARTGGFFPKWRARSSG